MINLREKIVSFFITTKSFNIINYLKTTFKKNHLDIITGAN